MNILNKKTKDIETVDSCHKQSYSKVIIWLVGFMAYQSLLGYLMLKSLFQAVIWFQVSNDKIIIVYK